MEPTSRIESVRERKQIALVRAPSVMKDEQRLGPSGRGTLAILERGHPRAFSRLRAMSAFDALGELRPIAIWNGVVARAVHGERVTLAVVELAPSSVVVEHAHENEQLGIVLRGSVRFRVGDEERELGPGETWRIPANTPHEVHTGTDGAAVIDVFGPPRDDWGGLET